MDIVTHINRRREVFVLRILFAVFAIIYCLISLVNHYEFRTSALDLGIFNNALYSFSHFKANHFTLNLDASNVNFFGDHFSPLVLLLVPFYWVFGSWAVLLVQIASILFGGLGIYKYCKVKFPESYIPLLITLQFFGIWGIYSALSFDFHANVVGAMFVPWLVYYHEKANRKPFLIFFTLILISKENMALWLSFIMLGLILKKGLSNYKALLRFEIPLYFFSLIYFLIIAGYVMPHLQNQQDNYQLSKYASLGNSTGQIIANILHDPLNVVKLFFTNRSGNDSFPGIKGELHFMVLASGGLALLYRPYYLVMLLPIYAQKLLTNNVGIWGISGQYSIEFGPILSLALADSIYTLTSTKLRYYVCAAYTLSTHIANINSIDHRRSLAYNSQNTRYYNWVHYASGLDLSAIYKALQLVPDNVPVSASCNLTPHLANREKIYAFPIIKDAEYIALFDTSVAYTYPISTKEYVNLSDTYKNSGAFTTLYDGHHLLILKKH